MPRKIKIYTVTILWIVIGLSILFTPILIVKIVLAFVAIGVTIHILLLKGVKKD